MIEDALRQLSLYLVQHGGAPRVPPLRHQFPSGGPVGHPQALPRYHIPYTHIPIYDECDNHAARPASVRSWALRASLGYGSTFDGLLEWLISTRFRRAVCPIGVSVRVAPVYLVSGGAPRVDGSSKTGTHRARSRFEVELFKPFPTSASFVIIWLRSVFCCGGPRGGLGPNGQWGPDMC